MVTTTEVKTYLKITDTALDSFFTTLIDECTDKINKYCRTTLSSSSRTFIFQGNGLGLKLIKDINVTAITALKYKENIEDSWITISSDFSLHKEGTLAYLYYKNGLGSMLYEVTYTAGYSTIPAELKGVCIEMVAIKYLESKQGENRLGKLTTSNTIQGQVNTTTFANLMSTRWADILNNYKVVLV